MRISDPQDLKITELDSRVSKGPANMLKAAIPYLDSGAAKTVALLAKTLELKNTLEYFSEETPISAASSDGKKPNPEEMLKDIRKYCNDEERERIDNLLNFINMSRMYETYKNLTGAMPKAAPTPGNDFMSSIQPMLTPEQLQMLQLISQQQNNS